MLFGRSKDGDPKIPEGTGTMGGDQNGALPLDC